MFGDGVVFMPQYFVWKQVAIENKQIETLSIREKKMRLQNYREIRHYN